MAATMLLLILIDRTGDVSYVPLNRTVTLGGRGEGHVPVAGLDGPALALDATEAGPRLIPRGPITILLNGRPPTHGRALRPGDELTFAGVQARVAESAKVDLEPGELGATAVLRMEDGSSDVEGASEHRVSLRNLRRLLDSADAAEPPLAPLLTLALEAGDGRRAALLARTPGGNWLVRLTSDEGDDPPALAVPAGLLDESAHDGTAVLARPERETGSLLVAPVRSSTALPLVLVVESDRPVEDRGVERLSDLAAIGQAGGLALDHRRRARSQATNERMTTIGRVMAGVAHDIKNLVTGLRTGIYYLDEPLSNSEESRVREAWEILKGAQGSIQALVGDMLAYSKPEIPSPEPTDLADVVRRALDHTRERVRAKEVDLVVTIAQLPSIDLDPTAIERCVLNLAGNAVDAVSAGSGRVEVRLDREGDEAVLTIADNGPGVPAEARHRVFDLLYSTKGVRGTGFGLAITRKIIEAHGGRIRLTSGAGGGATFEVRLPWTLPRE